VEDVVKALREGRSPDWTVADDELPREQRGKRAVLARVRRGLEAALAKDASLQEARWALVDLLERNPELREALTRARTEALAAQDDALARVRARGLPSADSRVARLRERAERSR
jgi:hypothetical protein